MEVSLKTNFYSSIMRDQVDVDSTPIDISEVIALCKEYAILGSAIQNQIDFILENGVEEAIKNNKITYIDYIKDFLTKMSAIYYLGDAALQAEDCLNQLNKIKTKSKVIYN